MTQRYYDGGYKYPNAYRTWLREQDTLLRVLSLKQRSKTGFQSTMSVEEISVILGRSPSSILKRASELELAILTQAQINELEDELKETERQ